MSPERTGPLTLRTIVRCVSSRNSTRTCVTLPVLPVRPRTLRGERWRAGGGQWYAREEPRGRARRRPPVASLSGATTAAPLLLPRASRACDAALDALNHASLGEEEWAGAGWLARRVRQAGGLAGSADGADCARGRCANADATAGTAEAHRRCEAHSPASRGRPWRRQRNERKMEGEEIQQKL